MPLAEIIKDVGIDWTDTFITWDGGTALECQFEITPTDFLRFANQESPNMDKRGIINAITNAKRSIDCQVDTLLDCIGYSPNSRLPENARDYIRKYSMAKDLSGIHSRLKLISALRAAPSRLISKIRNIRNLLEHEYVLPTELQALEAIELATLFVGSVSNVCNTFMDGFYVSNNAKLFEYNSKIWDNSLIVTFNNEHFSIGSKVTSKKIDRFTISKTEQPYLELIRLNIAIRTGGNVEDALYDLLQIINCNIPRTKLKVTVI